LSVDLVISKGQATIELLLRLILNFVLNPVSHSYLLVLEIKQILIRLDLCFIFVLLNVMIEHWNVLFSYFHWWRLTEATL